MKNDPIVEEVHKIRQKIWDECGHDWDKYFARMKKVGEKYRDRLITFEQLQKMRGKKVAGREKK